jgi:hypothetical protein
MGPLYDLQVTISSPRSRTGLSRFSAWHVEACVLQNLPRNYVLAGKRKALVGLNADVPHLASADRVIEGMRYVDLNTICAIDYGPFDFAAYRASSRTGRDEIVLAAIERGLTAIARAFGNDPEPIAAACAATRQGHFTVEREVKALSRSTRDRALRVHVARKFEHAGISWRLDIRTRKGGLVEERWCVKRGTHRDVKNWFDKSRIDGDTFVLTDEIGKDRVKLNLRKYRDAA